MRLELLPGAVLPRDASDDIDLERCLRDASIALASRDVPNAARAVEALARGRFSPALSHSKRAFELALDACALAMDTIRGRDIAVVADAHGLAASAGAIVAAVVRATELRADAYALNVAGRCVIDLLRVIAYEGDAEMSRRVSTALTAQVLALGAIGTLDAFAFVASSSAAFGHRGAFESPQSALEYAYACAYALVGAQEGGMSAFGALLEAWETFDEGAEYAAVRRSVFAGGALKLVLEHAVISGAISRLVALDVVRGSVRHCRVAHAYVVGAMYKASVVLRDAELREACVEAFGEQSRDVVSWTTSSGRRDVAAEARAFAFVVAMTTCLDVDEVDGTLRLVTGIVAQAACRVFSLIHGVLLHSRARGASPHDASRILRDLITSPLFINAPFIANVVSKDDGLGLSGALVTLASYMYDTARDIESSEWANAVDEMTLINARSSAYEFVLLALKNATQGRVRARVIEAVHVLTRMEFARTTTVEYAQMLGTVASALSSPESQLDSPTSVAFLSMLPDDISNEFWRSDGVLSARIHLTLRFLPFITSKLSSERIVHAVVPIVHACCTHELNHVVKAAHVAYVGIFHARPDLHVSLFPRYLRAALDAYPAMTPIEPFIAAVGIVTKLGDAGNDLGVVIAQEIAAKVQRMDVSPDTSSSGAATDRLDPPVEPLRRLLFQLITLVDFSLITSVRDIIQRAVLEAPDRSTRAARHRALAFTVMRCPDYARKPSIVDWVVALSSKL
jgi:hypothetical protein